MDKRKVLILITKSNWGGAQRYVYDIATNLPKDRYSVSVMAGTSGILIDKLKEAQIEAYGNLAIGRDVKLMEDIKAFFELIAILKKSKPDILHLNSSKIGGIGALAGRITGVKKIIFTSHGWAFNENRTLLSKIIIKVLHWITILLSHQTILVSENLKNQMILWPLIDQKMYIVHNAIKVEPIFSKVNSLRELSKVNPDLSTRLEKYDLKKTFIIGTIGELHHIKGHKYALEGIAGAIKTLKQNKSPLNILYLIIGSGEEKDNIEKTISELDIKDNVILLGYVKDAYHFMKSFDVFLLPSLSESFGYVLLEAGLASLPVIATAVGGIPEIIDDMKSGILIQSKKPREIQNAIEFYVKHKKTSKEHGLALREKTIKEFSIENMINETTNVYESQIESK